MDPNYQKRDESSQNHGPVYNGNMPYQLAHAITLIVVSIFAMIAVILRLWSRRMKKQALMLNDYLIILGLVSSNEIIS